MRGEPFTNEELQAARAQHGTHSECPKCKVAGDTDALFGWRRNEGSVIPQSWCTDCRSE